MNTAQIQWLGAAALLVGGLVRVMKPAIAPRWRPMLALMLGLVAGVLDALVRQTPMDDALVAGLVAAAVAALGHDVVIEGARQGSEL